MEWDLPDHRLEALAQLCVDRIRSNPDLSYPDIFTAPSELLDFYRFINNAHVDYGSLCAAYFEKTKKLCHNHKDILVLHDTTIVQPTSTSFAKYMHRFSYPLIPIAILFSWIENDKLRSCNLTAFLCLIGILSILPVRPTLTF